MIYFISPYLLQELNWWRTNCWTLMNFVSEFGVPATWQNCFLLHGFDPLKHTKQEFLEFCEQLEAIKRHLRGVPWRKAQRKSKWLLQGQGR
jgi:hypothetical protein